MALSDNLVAYYKLDSNSNDSVGSANGTDTSITYSSGIIGNGAESNAVTDRIYFGNPSSFQITGSQTVNFWIKGSSQGANNRNVFSAGGISGSSDSSLVIFHYSGGYLSFQISNGSTSNTIDLSTGQTSGILDGNLHMITFQFTPSTKIEVFKDGSSIASNTTSIVSSRSINKNWSMFKIDTNASPDPRDGFVGLIDELGIWSSVLSGAEITELYNSGIGKTYPFSTNSSRLTLLGVA